VARQKRRRKNKGASPLAVLTKPLVKLRKSVVNSHMMVNARFFWREIGTVNQVLIIAGAVFALSTTATLYKVFKDKYEMREIRCLAMNVYHEARGEPGKGKYAVAQVTMNRVKSPKYPNDVCRVVHQHIRENGQFSWTTDKISDIPQDSKAWLDAIRVAREVYRQEKTVDIGHALYYHADYVKPRWASHKAEVAKIGRHIFYK
jgi:hypothetical protein